MNNIADIAQPNKIEPVKPAAGRLHGLDLTRGLACLSMPIFHSVYNLYTVGLIDSQWTKHTFWQIYQHLGLGTFVLVSGMAFTISTQKGIRWPRLAHRALKLGLVALGITLVTYLAMPERFIRFGVIHFFTVTILLAPFFRFVRLWAVIPGLAVIVLAMMIPKSGVSPDAYLYITGLMSDRPRSMDYIPLVPWFGVFLVGMGLATLLKVPQFYKDVASWQKPIIWLGKHSLWFYLIHQIVVYGLLLFIAYLVK